MSSTAHGDPLAQWVDVGAGPEARGPGQVWREACWRSPGGGHTQHTGWPSASLLMSGLLCVNHGVRGLPLSLGER
jgi:hypothetical protein